MAPPSSRDYFDVHPPYMGGHTTTYGGYVWELSPHHPLANRWGYVAQHRLIAERLLGRPLVQHADPQLRECVHHKDENRLNNHPDNLEVLTFSVHRARHTRERNEREFAPRRPTIEAVAQALRDTPTIKDAAALVGVCHQTLRKHFPGLLAPYKRRKPTIPLEVSGAKLDLLRRLAADPLVGERELAAQMEMSPKTARKVCRLNGIPWVRKSRKGEKQRKRANLVG